MATIKLNKNKPASDKPSGSGPRRAPVRGGGGVGKPRPTLAQAQADRAERQAAYEQRRADEHQDQRRPGGRPDRGFDQRTDSRPYGPRGGDRAEQDRGPRGPGGHGGPGGPRGGSQGRGPGYGGNFGGNREPWGQRDAGGRREGGGLHNDRDDHGSRYTQESRPHREDRYGREDRFGGDNRGPAARRPDDRGPRGDRPGFGDNRGGFGHDRGGYSDNRGGDRGSYGDHRGGDRGAPRGDGRQDGRFENRGGPDNRYARDDRPSQRGPGGAGGAGGGGGRYGEGPRDDRPRGPRTMSDRPAGNRYGPDNGPHHGPAGADRGWSDRPQQSRPGDRPYGDRPYGERPYGDRPYGDRPQGDRPYGDRPYGDRPRSDRPRPQHQADGEFDTPRPRNPAPQRLADPAEGERLSKRMSELGLASRREADEWIEAGWVTVDGKLAELGQRVGPDVKIEIDPAARQEQAQRVTILLHKPIGYVSGQAEDGYEPASVLVKADTHWAEDPATGIHWAPGHGRNLAPAGRLDIDSTGLLVLTQDGRIARHLIGEDSNVEKEYLVRVTMEQGNPEVPAQHQLDPRALALLNHGLELDGVELKPAKVSWANEDQLRFVLREGRKRQIRRMCEQVGLKVVGLKRVRIGRIPLGQLPAGQWRYLAPWERF
ncbi:23S rRNA pseudouridine2604 synthase [Roseateles sp. YR242]|uniref:pseudouridine synthase n=1 Tax=Roseateles sp. YR242 TaxID=1855305 RepID=UPI0008B4EDFF|nr:pseudouridine synthase [Roseateles sp. YR242]SEK27175.1 23S rRNA pseudouridine2604 synthase [Roseateles sp. YR242]